MIHKKTALLLTPKIHRSEVLQLSKTYLRGTPFIAINGDRLSIRLEESEMDPIWLLDIRRAGIPYLWLWGDEQHWVFTQVTRFLPRNPKSLVAAIHTNESPGLGFQHYKDVMNTFKFLAADVNDYWAKPLTA